MFDSLSAPPRDQAILIVSITTATKLKKYISGKKRQLQKMSPNEQLLLIHFTLFSMSDFMELIEMRRRSRKKTVYSISFISLCLPLEKMQYLSLCTTRERMQNNKKLEKVIFLLFMQFSVRLNLFASAKKQLFLLFTFVVSRNADDNNGREATKKIGALFYFV